MVNVGNFVDTWVAEQRPKVPRPKAKKLWLRSGSPNAKVAFVHHGRPFPLGATILSAKFRFYNGDAWSGSTTISLRRLSEKFKVNSLTYDDQPGVGGAVFSQTKTGAAAGTMWEIDITDMMQVVANGGAWYGFRITTTRTTDGFIHSSESSRSAMRPMVIVEWTTTPDQPDSLEPSGGRAVSVLKPWFQYEFLDDDGENGIAGHRFQFAATEEALLAGTPSYDTNEIVTNETEWDSSTSSWPGIAEGATVWWRVCAKNSANKWSDWSDPVSFVRLSRGTLTINSPTTTLGFTDGSPMVSWTMTNRTQKAYQVIVTNTTDNEEVYVIPKTTSGTQSVTIPFDEIIDTSKTYSVTVRVWDTIDRSYTVGEKTFYEATVENLVFKYDNAIAGVTNLSMASDPIFPVARLTWSRSTAPDVFQILRSDDGGPFMFVEEGTPSEFLISGSNYEFVDTTAPSYQDSTWRVVPVVGNKMGNIQAVNGNVRRISPVIMRPDRTDILFLLNPDKSREPTDVQELHTTRSGNNVLITQTRGKQRGSVSGLLADGVVSGYTAESMLKAFERLRRDSGVRLRLFLGRKTHTVVAFNMYYEEIIDREGIMYLVHMDWAEV